MAHTYIYKLDICRSNSAVNIQGLENVNKTKKVFILFELAEIEKTFSTSDSSINYKCLHTIWQI